MRARSGFFRIPNWRPVSLSVVVFLVCLFYTYALVCLVPYPGFDFGGDWIIRAFEPCEADVVWCEVNRDVFQVGDQLLVISDLTYAEHMQARGIPFWGYGPGDEVFVTLRRDGEELTTYWRMLGPTTGAQFGRLMRILIYVPFWLAGTLVLLFLQPRDLRWWLLISFNYAIAILLAVGSCSAYRIAYSPMIGLWTT